MARRGRFGRAEAGSSNLSSLIQQLIREQKAAEERILLDSFYGGTALYGSVPTLSDVIDFYKDLANLGGFEEDSMEYQALLQKIDAATNFDSDEEYKDLIADFETGFGENYDQLMGFLNGRATSSTNQDALDKYAQEKNVAASKYINFRGQDLVAGFITQEEFRSLSNSVIDSIPEGDPIRARTLVDSYTFEWNALSKQYKDRVDGGTMSEAQYIKWAKEFRSSMVAAGVPETGGLFDTVGATIKNFQESLGGGRGAAAETRLSKLTGDLNSLYLSVAGIGIDVGVSGFEDIAGAGEFDTLGAMAKNPEVLASLFDYMDNNPGYSNPALARLGIESGDEGRVWLDKALKNGLYESQIANKDIDKWKGATNTNGSLSALDDFALASTKWMADKASAMGDPTLLSFYNNEWKKYVAGMETGLQLEKSIYGSIPLNGWTQEQIPFLLAEQQAAFGSSSAETKTISGFLDERADQDWANFNTTDQEAINLQTGAAVLVYDPVTKGYKYDGVQASGLSKGSYQYVEFIEVGGKVIARTISVRGVEVKDSNGAVVAYRYELPGDKVKVIDTKGYVIDAPTIERSGEGFVVGKDGLGAQGKVAPDKDYSKLTPEGRGINLDFDPSDPEQRRALIATQGISEDTYRQAAAAFDAAKPGLGQETLYAGPATPSSADLIAEANEVAAQRVENSPRGQTIEGKIEVANFRGETTRAEGYQFILDNQDKITMVNGLPQLRPEYANQAAGAANAGAQVGAGIGAVVGAPFAGGLAIPAFAAVGGLLGGTLGRENIEMDVIAAQEKILTPEQKAKRAKRVSETPQFKQYEQTGYPAGASTFFRNMPNPNVQQAPRISPYLATQATISPAPSPLPARVSVPRPRPKTPRVSFSPGQITQSLVDFRKGEREMD
jgi:hypothetical protein